MFKSRPLVLALCLVALLALIWQVASNVATWNRRRAFEQAIWDRRRAFGQAIERGDLRTLRALLDEGEPIGGDPDDLYSIPPLQLAAAAGQDDVVRFLLDRGAKYCGSSWGTPLGDAALEGHVSTVKLLLERCGLQGAARQAELDYALWGAAAEGKASTVKLLLESGANPNYRYPEYSLLRLCKENGHTAVSALLKKAGARE
jgi:ankyrin repeat protein